MTHRRPNIVWISTHDINPHLGCYEGVYPGAENAITPHLDALAASGVRYDQAFAAAPVCAPSRSAIYTGCYPTATGAMHMRSRSVPPPDVRLLPEYFREAGYYCTNNWFTDFQVEVPPYVFDECGTEAHWRGRDSEDQPFFAAFHSLLTHESRIHLDDASVSEITANVSAGQRRDPEALALPPYYPDTPAIRRTWRSYHELITEMDHWVGGILAQLEEDGLAENTIVVFWSDHGVGMPRAKRFAYESGLREPLIARWPGHITPGSVMTEPVQLMDLAPTMLEACGLPIPDHMHGAPLFGSRGDLRPGRRVVVSGRDRMGEQQDSTRTIRDQRFRYIRHRHPGRPLLQHSEYPDRLDSWHEFRRLAHEESEQLATGHRPGILTALQRSIVAAEKPAEELYDIAADPHETVNLIDSTEHEEILDGLRAELDAWEEQYTDLGLRDELELLEEWRPGGVWPEVPMPKAEKRDSGWSFTCELEGARVAWTEDPPAEARERSPLEITTGAPEDDGRLWHLADGPLSPPEERPFTVRAWRLGYLPSSELHVTPIYEEA